MFLKKPKKKATKKKSTKKKRRIKSDHLIKGAQIGFGIYKAYKNAKR
jgi:hypothetical protein